MLPDYIPSLRVFVPQETEVASSCQLLSYQQSLQFDHSND
jgi:hypothetical protein